MKTKQLLLPFVLGLAGCQTIAPTGVGATVYPPNPDCPDQIRSVGDWCFNNLCAIAVQVVTNPADGKCMVVVGSDPMRMAHGNRGANNDGVVLHWWLPLNSKFEFRTESGPYTLPINFKDQNAPNLKDQFSPAYLPPMTNGYVVRLIDKNTYKYQYDYRVRVYKRGSNPPEYIESTDPALYNDF